MATIDSVTRQPRAVAFAEATRSNARNTSWNRPQPPNASINTKFDVKFGCAPSSGGGAPSHVFDSNPPISAPCASNRTPCVWQSSPSPVATARRSTTDKLTCGDADSRSDGVSRRAPCWTRHLP